MGSFAGPTTISAGTLALGTGTSLQDSTLVAPTTGSIVVGTGVSTVFIGGLSGAGI